MLNLEKLYTRSEIQEAIKRMGAEISKDYQGKEVVLLGLLKGCTVFMSHLLVQIEGDVAIEFMTVSSYKGGTVSGDLELIQDLQSDISGKHIILVEDIIDSGKTIDYVIRHLEGRGAASIELAVFVNKTSNIQYAIPAAKYVGFNYNQEEFVVGFGFDVGEKYRNLPEVYRIIESA